MKKTMNVYRVGFQNLDRVSLEMIRGEVEVHTTGERAAKNRAMEHLDCNAPQFTITGVRFIETMEQYRANLRAARHLANTKKAAIA
jgi:hypothetical protein